jgi:SAM-dependent methyltransferase
MLQEAPKATDSDSQAAPDKSKKEKAPKEKKPKKAKKAKKADTVDKYDLYQRAVQAPDADIEFFDQVFEEHNGRKPLTLREDFCAAFHTCCEWVRTRPENECWGIDLDPEPVEWGKTHNLSKLNEEQKSRIHLVMGDVRDPREDKVDIVAAQNFSYCIFGTRAELRAYFEAARKSLKPGGMLMLDIFGGPESNMPGKEPTKHKGFTYVWHQKEYDAITNRIKCAIHFKFKDGSKIKNAFTYDGRLWTIAELRELLIEAGFTAANAYWEGTEDGDDGELEGDGVFTRQEKAENEEAWIAYVVGINA